MPLLALLRKPHYGTRLSVAIAPAHPSSCSPDGRSGCAVLQVTPYAPRLTSANFSALDYSSLRNRQQGFLASLRGS